MTRPHDPPLILCVEDEEALRRDIVEELQEAGYRVIEAADGQAALTLLGDATPDLILCDISMPGLDGRDLLTTLRAQRPELGTTPFVFLTALSEPRDIIDGKLLGADDYLVKPIDYDLMLATITAHLRQVHRIRAQDGDELMMLRDALGGLSDDGTRQALDLLALGVVLLDGRAQVLHANHLARRLSDEGDAINIQAQGVRATETPSNRALQQALSATLDASRTGQESLTGVMLHRTNGAGPVQALLSALPRRGGTQGDGPAVVLFLSTPERGGQLSQSLLMDLFALTPAEARLASALAKGARPADVAATLGVSQTTIAFHLRNLFQKTGTHRQAELVALILAGPMVMKPD